MAVVADKDVGGDHAVFDGFAAEGAAGGGLVSRFLSPGGGEGGQGEGPGMSERRSWEANITK